MTQADIIIIGSGMGGAMIASSLAPSGARILILERGERLAPSPQDRDADAIFRTGHFRDQEQWHDGADKPFSPGNYYMVGGNSKFYGAALIRYRAEDFRPIAHLGGTTPGWPISYDTLEPYYAQAETLFEVRGRTGEDPTEPWRSAPYPQPAIADEPDIARFRQALAAQGLNPSAIPLAVDLDRWAEGGKTTWDGHPGTNGGKRDGEHALDTALAHLNVELRTGTRVTRLRAGADGTVNVVEAIGRDGPVRLTARIVILAAGAVQSAALLLRSADEARPTGLANRSDQVGRNFMNHNCSAVLGLHPFRRNRAIYQKTLMLNDFYLEGGPQNAPLGNVQMLGKITGPILAATSGLPRPLAYWIAARSLDVYVMSEDLPNPESRVTLRGDGIRLNWQRSNMRAHAALVAKVRTVLRRAGCPITLAKAFDRRTPSHQCGTARMGDDPATSVTDPLGRCHDHPNLFIADASLLPTSAAVNPALTVAALALRSGQHIRDTILRDASVVAPA
ncbi:FAD-dependent oxidoreductase [Pontivivens insulae]|uniref:Paromamine 6'-oxidase n=1 Tax=Pontivivens insulae TaxID=1639689 RepID=A0A2R8AE50_9RHOB|nr:GMC family oxidoreductase [Pontivivens insulae]RED14426.1 choline dehydrogenase-like flavoprotein [Pontivivens insulae]SPF30504.1 Paromamine 6'-oxidase [Pontivivens insulae]